jgi:hypothetical protein
MEEIKFLATKLKEKYAKEAETELLPLIYNHLITTAKFIEIKQINNEPEQLKILDDITSLGYIVEYRKEQFRLELSKSTYENCTVNIRIYSDKNVRGLKNNLYKFKIAVKNSLIVCFGEFYWEEDTQNIKVSKILYEKIHRVENKFRNIINVYMIRNFGFSWFDNIINKEDQDKVEKFATWYRINSKYKDFKKVQLSLFNLQIDDLVKMLKKSFYYGEKYDRRFVEQLKRKASGVDKSLLKEEYKTILDSKSIWDASFSKFFDKDFEGNWNKFGNMRNMIAHNKPICLDLCRDAYSLSEKLMNVFSIVEEQINEENPSQEETIAEHLHEEVKIEIEEEIKGFYFKEAGLDKIPDNAYEAEEKIKTIQEINEFIAIYEEFKDNYTNELEMLDSVLTGIQNLRPHTLSKQEIKEFIRILCDVIYFTDIGKKQRFQKYSDCVSNKNGLIAILSDVIEDIEEAKTQLSSIVDEMFCTQFFQKGKILKLKGVDGECLEVIVEGELYNLYRGGSDELDIKIIENGELNNECMGSINIDYGDYQIDDCGYAMPVNESGIGIDIDCVLEHVKSFTKERMESIKEYIEFLDRYAN